MARTTETTADDWTLRSDVEYEHSGETRSVEITQDDTGNGVWLYVDGEIEGYYHPVEIAKELGTW